MTASKERIVLFGGAGFIGSHMAEDLANAGYRVRVFGKPDGDWRNVRILETRVELFPGDFYNQVDVRAALQGCDAAVHLIASTIPATSNSNPAYDVESSLIPTLRFLDEARARGLARIFFVSSGGTIYGRARQIPIPEEHPTEPLCSYAVVKLAIEKYLGLHAHLHGGAATVLRFSNPYGERQNPAGAQGAIAVFLGRVFDGRAIEIWGTGEVVRDYIDIKDAVRAFRLLLEQPPASAVYNVGSGQGVSLNALVDEIRAVTGRDVAVTRKPGRAVDVPVNVLDTARLRDAVGWRPEIPLREGIARTWDWIRQDRWR